MRKLLDRDVSNVYSYKRSVSCVIYYEWQNANRRVILKQKGSRYYEENNRRKDD